MTPPHSPSSADASTAATSGPDLGHTHSLTGHSPSETSAPPPPQDSSPSQMGRAMATSVIRHTADRLPLDAPPPPASSPIPQRPLDLLTSEQTSGAPVSPLHSSCSSSPPAAAPLLCQVFPVGGAQAGMISAFVQAPVAVRAGPAGMGAGPKPLLPQSLLQGTVMFVVPQAPVAPTPQAVVTLGSAKLLPLAPAPLYVPATGGGASQADFSRRRNYLCNFSGCKKTYFKSSHLKAHLRTHTGWQDHTALQHTHKHTMTPDPC